MLCSLICLVQRSWVVWFAVVAVTASSHKVWIADSASRIYSDICQGAAENVYREEGKQGFVCLSSKE
jgi:hypothetical protein